jgi:arginyl-tRNA synthetase
VVRLFAIHHRDGFQDGQTLGAAGHLLKSPFPFNYLGELLYRHLERRLTEHMREFLRRQYGIEPERIVIEQPPKVEFGEFALPLAFELAKKLRKAPRKIAEEIVAGIGPIEGFEKFEVAGAGYINARVDRGAVAAALVNDEAPQAEAVSGKILVEHTSINPNKAAHIGHLRNAILGDTFVRLLQFAGRQVDVQNYIDNTGVQVADVVVGFLRLEKKSRAEVEQLACQPRFDYYCWDLYAKVSQWYEENAENKKVRLQTLHKIEQGGNETAAIADLISTAVLRRHLETMDRLDIEYDFLPRESEILHLHFWDAAFEKLKEAGVFFFETEGKNKGCWVMRRAGSQKHLTAESAEKIEIKPEDLRVDTWASPKSEALRITHIPSGVTVTSDSAGSQSKNREKAMILLRNQLAERLTEEDQKVIVRSNGTVGYVGKDIAYHMWKFGLLGKDFGYEKFYVYPNKHQVWVSAEHGEPEHPHFGDVERTYNVIDARQSEAQNAVIEALRGLGHGEYADKLTHFSYEMVALTPRCAAELGYELSEDDKARPYVEVSGRRGFGVKADDLIDRLIESAAKEVDSRHPERENFERQEIAEQIAIGALRYFMLKYTKPSVIAFDFKEALSFEGETGPYAQYAVVRATNIFRKGGMDAENYDIHGSLLNLSVGPTSRKNGEKWGTPISEFLRDDDLWDIWLAASKTGYVIDQCIATTEPAYLAKHVFQLAQMFNTFYHRYPILSEPDEERKRFLLATAAVVRRELIRALAVMGIAVPAVM